jgi:hypothetical protein
VNPYDGSVGYSDWTPTKHATIARALGAWKLKAGFVAAKHTVTFGLLDATSGTGHINGSDGTPLLMAQIARSLPGAQLACYERDPGSWERLSQRVGAAAICADSVETLIAHERHFPRYGLLLWDPNPGLEGGLPVDALNAWARHGRRDALIHISATSAYKRIGRAQQLVADLEALAWDQIGISQPQRDQHWTFLFATRWRPLLLGVCRACGWAPLDSPEGQEWLRIASTPGAQSMLPGQLRLGL